MLFYKFTFPAPEHPLIMIGLYFSVSFW